VSALITTMFIAGATLTLLLAGVRAGEAQEAGGQADAAEGEERPLPHHTTIADEQVWLAIEDALHRDDRDRLATLGAKLPAGRQAAFAALMDAYEEDTPSSRLPGAPAAPDVGRNGQSCSYPTIGDAIAAANNGDVIYIPSGNTYNERLGDIGKDLAFVAALSDCSGPDPAADSSSVRINGGGQFGGIWGGVAVINRNHIVTFTHVTLEHASANNGGILYVDPGAVLVLDDSDVTLGEATTVGGGVRVYSSTLLMKNGSRAYSNVTTGAGDGAGIAVYNGVVTMTGGSGVGIAPGGGNYAADKGGGAYLDSSRLFMDDASLVNNHAITEGGAVYALGASLIEMQQDSRIGGDVNAAANTADYGGGVYLVGNGGLVVTDTGALVGNEAFTVGGGVFAQSGAYVTLRGGDATIMSNTADFSGGGLYLTDENTRLNIIYGGGRIVGNATPGTFVGYGGGGVYVTDGASVYGEQAVIRDNETDWYGGGILVAQNTRPVVTPTEVILLDSDVLSNVATQGGGAGMYVRDEKSRVTVQNSRFVNNESADGVGGAIRMGNDSAVTLTQGTLISDNLGGHGGGLSLLDGRVSINDVQILHNIGYTRAGGIHQQGGTIEAIDPDIRYNSGGSFGGGIYHEAGGLYLAAVNKEAHLSHNSAAEGAGLYEMSSSGATISAGDGYAFNLNDNYARGSGGAAYVRGHTPLIAHGQIVVRGNHASGFHGGAFYLTDDATVWLAPTGSSPAPQVIGNSAQVDGGAFYASNGSHIRLEGTTVGAPVGPNSAQDGGGVYAEAGSEISLDGGFVGANRASDDGAGFFLTDSSAAITATWFISNQGTGGGTSVGSALWVGRDATAEVTNSLFSGNNSSAVHVYSNAAYHSDSSTYADNTDQPLYVVSSAAGVTLTNNIMWDNANPALYQSGAPLTTQCNDTQNALSGPGDISAEPQFTAVQGTPYHLAFGSPAMDACSSGPAEDFAGVSRPQDGDGTPSPEEYDMGALERERVFRVYLPAIIGPGP
jgi:hypothetical protein